MATVQSKVSALRELAEPKLNYAMTTSREGLEKSIAALKAAFDMLASAAASRDLTELEQELRRLVADADRILMQCVTDLKERTAEQADQLRGRYEEVVTVVESGAQRVRAAAQSRLSDARSRVTAATDSAVASATQAAAPALTRVRTELKQLGSWADDVVARARAAAAEAVEPAERWAGDARSKLEETGAQLRSQVEPKLQIAQGWAESRSPEAVDKLDLSVKEARAVLAEGFSVQAVMRLLVTLLLVLQAVLFLALPAATEWSVWGPSPPPTPVAAAKSASEVPKQGKSTGGA